RPARRRHGPRPQPQYPPEPDQEARHFAIPWLIPVVGREMSRGPSSGVSALLPTRRPPQPPTYQALRTKRTPGIAHRHAVRFSVARRYEEAGDVLRITRLSQKGGLTIKLEGEIVGAWVGAARDACAIRGRRPRRLDLAAVTYVDAAGLQLLRDLMAEGVEI